MAQIPDIDVTTISVGGTAYTVPFEYQTQAEVFVTVDGSPVAFTWINAGNISITPAPAVGAAVRRYRSTAATSIRHDYRNGVPFTPKNIAENNDQLLYVVQEAVSTSVDALTQTQANTLLSEQALATADAAVATANTAETLASAAVADSAAALATATTAEANSIAAVDTSNATSAGLVALGADVASIASDLDAAEAKLATVESGAQVNVPTNLSMTSTSSAVTIISSTGDDVVIPAVSGTKAGLMLPYMLNKLAGIADSATANPNTDSLVEGVTNKYYTDARVRSAPMTGLAPVAGEAVATDSLLTAVSKLQTQATATAALIDDALQDSALYLRNDLANTTDPAKGAGMVGRAAQAVDSVLTLISLPADQRRADQRFLVKGYHLGSNVGGGEFYWDAGRAKTEHDGGAVIDPSVPWDGSQAGLAGFLAGTGGAAGNGCWVRVLGDCVSPEMFGAVGNLTVDDYAALQACADAVSLTGKILFTGTYSSTDTVCVVGNNIHIEGTARSLLKRADYSTVASASHPRGCVLLVGDDINRYVNAVIVGVNIDGNATNQAVYTTSQHARGIYIARYDGVRVEGCRVNNNPMVGISFRFCNGLSVLNNEASYNGITVSGEADKNGISLGTAGSSTPAAEPLENAIAIGNKCIGNYDTGIMFGWFRRVIISGNIIKGVGTWGWGIEGTPAGAVMPTTTNYIGDICISDNVIENTRIGIHVSVSKAGNYLVSGNTLRNVASSNLMLAAGAGGSIVASGNIMENAFHNNDINTYHAVYLDAELVIFKDNILNFPEAETPVLGYAVSARGADISIHDNKLHNPHNGIQVNYYASGVKATAQYSLSIVGNNLYKPRTNQVNSLIGVVFTSGMAGKVVRLIEISRNTMSSRKSGNVLQLDMSQADCLLKNVRIVDNVYQDDLYTGDDRAGTALAVLPPPTTPIESFLIRGNSFKDTRYIAMPTLSGAVSMIDRSNNIELPGFRTKGTTAQRPVLISADQKYVYFDTTLGKSVWWTGTAWKDAAGVTV